jgi:predicted nucleic acid-binding Zn ribbon protein
VVLVASYEYKCDTDSRTVEVERGMTEEEVIPICEFCDSEMVRIYNAAPVKFNGTGFYSTGG